MSTLEIKNVEDNRAKGLTFSSPIKKKRKKSRAVMLHTHSRCLS